VGEHVATNIFAKRYNGNRDDNRYHLVGRLNLSADIVRFTGAGKRRLRASLPDGFFRAGVLLVGHG